MTDMDYSKTGIFDRHNSDLTKQKNKELYAMYEAYYEKKHYIGLAGVLRFIADGFIFAAVVWYCIAAGGLLPLYVKDYGSLGSDKALFWMSSYNTPFKLLILGAAFLLSAFLVKLVTVEGAGPSFFERG